MPKIGTNVRVKRVKDNDQGEKLVFTVKMGRKDYKETKSGKSLIVANTGGLASLEGISKTHPNLRVNILAIIPKDK